MNIAQKSTFFLSQSHLLGIKGLLRAEILSLRNLRCETSPIGGSKPPSIAGWGKDHYYSAIERVESGEVKYGA
jgi:hypothetical protein